MLFFKDRSVLQAYIPLVIMTCGLVIYGMVSSIGSAFLGIGKPEVILKISMLRILPILILGNILLIPGFWIIPPLGMIGAAVATSTSLVIGALVNIILLTKYTKIVIDWQKILLISAIAAIIGIGACVMALMVHPILAFLCGAGLFALVIYFMNIFTKNEIKMVTSILTSFFKKE